MQNLKPLQEKRKIMSNKEAMEELERYNPPKEETKEEIPEQNLESKVDDSLGEELKERESKNKKNKKVLFPFEKNLDFYVGTCISGFGASLIGTTPFLSRMGLSESDYGVVLYTFLIGGSLLILLGIHSLYQSYKEYKR